MLKYKYDAHIGVWGLAAGFDMEQEYQARH